MKSNVESRLRNYESDVKKFEARWQQLRPSDSVLDDDTGGGSGAGEKAVQLIRDKKLEFAELETTREALEYVLSHLHCVCVCVCVCDTFSWRGLVVNMWCRINVVALRRARLVPGWVTVCRQVNHLGI